MAKWDAAQWEAYCRVVLITFQEYIEKAFFNHSFVLYRAKSYIERAVSDLYKINGRPNSAFDENIHAKPRVIIKFIKDAIGILEKKGVPEGLQFRVRKSNAPRTDTFYDRIAKVIFEVIFWASQVKSPVDPGKANRDI